MRRFFIMISVCFALLCSSALALAQQGYRLPDIRSLKHLTTKKSDHAPDIPGNETSMEYYSSPHGSIVTIYSYLGRNIAFSTHTNKDNQRSYRLFVDLRGNGMFQEVNRASRWHIPAWARN